MELVDGEDLAERLKRGAIPVDEALEIAKQIAEALEEAHGKGIVHRDLKPANVKLTADDKVKVLDFGLAKAWAGDGGGGTSSADVSHSPTMTRATEAGMILGTAAYMSPEQARGKSVDKRADIWAFVNVSTSIPGTDGGVPPAARPRTYGLRRRFPDDTLLSSRRPGPFQHGLLKGWFVCGWSRPRASDWPRPVPIAL